jgi:hypothetical protein
MHKTLPATESQSPVSGSRGPWLRGLEEAGNQLNLHGFKLEAGQYGYSMEWWPNEDASCVPVFDGGAAEGPLSGCLHCFNNEGSFQSMMAVLSSQALAFWRGLVFEAVSDGIHFLGIHGWPVSVRVPPTRPQNAATHVGSKGRACTDCWAVRETPTPDERWAQLFVVPSQAAQYCSVSVEQVQQGGGGCPPRIELPMLSSRKRRG